MELLQLILHNFVSFISIISLIVFVHEFGHFFVARKCGVKIDVFSIGFGKEIFGRTDKHGTRWKLSLIPLGGYVKMHGDKNAASVPDLEELQKMSAEEKHISFSTKNVYQRIAIVVAGPVANFLLAITIFTFLFKLNGLNTILPTVGEVIENGAAFEAGIKKGDEILTIDGEKISDFNEMRQMVIDSKSEKMLFEISRDEQILKIYITPKTKENTDFFGEKITTKFVGIGASKTSHQDLNLAQAFVQANLEAYKMSLSIFSAIGELITGKRSVEELGGPIKIASYSGKTVEMGASVVLWFMAMISLNLGVMNLLPIPGLDGGHLIYYFIEVILRRPLSHKTQMIGFQIGMSLLFALMVFTTFNDVRHLFN